ncbi:embryonic polyadenylate-binding protein 2 [Octodon degus]|uniref:Embryonic polyadenylate-binding protein 2 n=1 Tax=Octodon degus TaxID=10160 RepID=A0A6P6DMW6_OCTDE|nr:embryonic polyadenylate-binding protein 2 [Octodon degus]
MWPFLSRTTLFPPPTEDWLQTVSSDPEAQGWGACAGAEKTPLEPESVGGSEAEEANVDARDSDFLLSLLESNGLAKGPEADQELEAIRLKLWTMEQVQEAPEPSSTQAKEEEGAGARQLLRSGTVGCPFPGVPRQTVEADHRSIYVGNVDYGGTAEELQAHFHPCGEVHRVTILCDKFSGHPKGYAYVEFTTQRSAQAAVELDKSIFRGRVIKVLPKRTNFPGISSTDRGGPRGHLSARMASGSRSSLQGRPRLRLRLQGQGR